MEDAAIKTIMAAATENAQAFLSEAESLSLKHIDEFRAGKEDDINVLVAILTDGAITDQELLSRFTEIFLEAEPVNESPIILLN